MLKRNALWGAALALALITAPTAAQAVGDDGPGSLDDYVGEPRAQTTPAVVEPCELATVLFQPGYFTPGEHVSLDLHGVNAASADFPNSVNAADDGGLVLEFAPPAGASGLYTVDFRADSAQYSTTLNVFGDGTCFHDPVPDAEPTATAGGSPAAPVLAVTGSDPVPWLIGGGITLALGTGLFVAGSRRRRSHD